MHRRWRTGALLGGVLLAAACDSGGVRPDDPQLRADAAAVQTARQYRDLNAATYAAHQLQLRCAAVVLGSLPGTARDRRYCDRLLAQEDH